MGRSGASHVERLCEWERPRAPAVGLMFDDVRAAPAVLSFLRDTLVGQMIFVRPRGGEGKKGESGREDDTESGREDDAGGEEGGPGPP